MLERFVINTATCKAQITTLTGGNGINRELFRQRSEGFTLVQTLLDGCHGLLCLGTCFNQDMGGTTLFTGKVFGPLVIIATHFLVGDVDGICQRIQRQGDVGGRNLFRFTELVFVVFVVRLDVCIRYRHLVGYRIGINRQYAEIPGLVLDSQQLLRLGGNRKAGLGNRRTDLVNHVVLAQAFTEFGNTHTQVTHSGHKPVAVELAIHLELGHLGNQGVDVGIGKFEALVGSVLGEHGFLDQSLQNIPANLVFIHQ